MRSSVRFFYDYASPFSYVASALIDRGALDAVISYEPTYLRGLELFQAGVPYSAAKLTYLMNDLTRVCRHHAIPLAPPAAFPVNGLYALRGALLVLEGEGFLDYHRRAFSRVWAESRPLDSAEAAAEVAAEVGLDRDEFVLRLAEPSVKAELKRRTDAAAALGVFGVPGFVVGTELFWGHDRLDYVARALAASDSGRG